MSTKKGMAHHKAPPFKIIYKNRKNKEQTGIPYGVPSSLKVLRPNTLSSHWNLVRLFFIEVLGLSTAEREAAFRLLRLYTYYQFVYPKASQICEEPGCSKRTFWRTVAILVESGFLQVVNRFVLREEAQISNLYVLPRFRRHGIGAALVAHLLEVFSRQNVRHVELSYLVHNEAGAEFWTSQGFIPESVRAVRMPSAPDEPTIPSTDVRSESREVRQVW